MLSGIDTMHVILFSCNFDTGLTSNCSANVIFDGKTVNIGL